ncbi:amidohydrolase [Marmoricola sp. URHB0036]|uniref:amidohydrolase n=1 Tax=Marmoricola sp. URHB0036 TaxID=1298863 RepID=UPI000421E850|nr:amidohydrolase family protein [Marmoricola sp. URHB0036]
MSDFVLRDVRLVPLRGDPAPAEPVDVRVADGHVTEVGPSLAVGGAEVRAEGRWLVPGLWDQHVHLGQWALASLRLDLTGTRSVEEALARVSTRLAELPDVPIVGWGHRSAGWDRQPTVRELDEVSGIRPVVLISGDGHHAWINTVALRGLRLPERDGVVSESEWFKVYPRLAEVVGADGTSPDAYLHTMQQAAAKGVTGLVDLEFDQGVRDWPEREAAGAELLRVRVGAYVDTLDDFLRAGVPTGASLPGCGPLVTMGPLKVISDGSLNTRTAWCCSEYSRGGGTGAPNITSEGLRNVMEAGNRHHLEVAIHAIGDAAVEQALKEFEATGARGSIEHAQLISREDSRTMARLGVRASVQPAHLLDDRDLTESFWPDRTDRCFALRWLHDDGVELALGSDAPVSPLDPWLAIAAAVHRSADDRDPWHPEQSLTPAEALGASTDGRGTVAPGHPADLALLDADPLAPGSSLEQATALRSMHVAATWVAGSLVHSEL